MPKLKDPQLVILSAAAQRDGGAALPLSKSLKIKDAAITKTLDSLRRQGLLEERPGLDFPLHSSGTGLETAHAGAVCAAPPGLIAGRQVVQDRAPCAVD